MNIESIAALVGSLDRRIAALERAASVQQRTIDGKPITFTGASQRQFIQTGSITATPDASGDITITFPEAFAAAPFVEFAAYINTGVTMSIWGPSLPTTTGFTVRVFRGGVAWTGSITVHWVATGD